MLPKKVSALATSWDSSFGFLGGVSFGINLPKIHPLEVIAAITDGVPCSERRQLLSSTKTVACQIPLLT
jgi:hypothetical protein